MNENRNFSASDTRLDRRVARDAKERLTEDLRRLILTLKLEPGSHLDETGLSQEYGISRTPLRDVFRQLAGEGYILLRDNRGAMVAPMNHKTLRLFLQTAPLIYTAIARLAAENAQAHHITALREAQDTFRQAVASGAVAEIVYTHALFHQCLGEISENPYLQPSLQRVVIDHARIGLSFWQGPQASMAEVMAQAAEHQDRLIALLEARDVEATVALSLAQWTLSRTHFEAAARPEPLPLDAGR
ncbi:MAG: GntR family transcriptional regulator [Pseudomonadota bacterium]